MFCAILSYWYVRTQFFPLIQYSIVLLFMLPGYVGDKLDFCAEIIISAAPVLLPT